MSRSAHHPSKSARRWPPGRNVWIVALVLVTLIPSGCVRRRLMVRSNPAGALVYVDNQQIGTTPCSVDFTYYGTREIRLIKPGYETLTVNQPIPTPWYEIPPLDFVSENMVPSEVHDNRTVTYNLSPQVIVPTQQLLDRAEQLRQQTLQEPVVPASASEPVGPVPSPVIYPTAPPPVATPPAVPAPTYASPPPASAVPGPTYSPAPLGPQPAMPLGSPLPVGPPAASPSSQEGRPLVSPPLR